MKLSAQEKPIPMGEFPPILTLARKRSELFLLWQPATDTLLPINTNAPFSWHACLRALHCIKVVIRSLCTWAHLLPVHRAVFYTGKPFAEPVLDRGHAVRGNNYPCRMAHFVLF